MALGLLATVPATFAYGNNTQWQVGFSGTCDNPAFCGQIGLPPGMTGGFWGWCAFGGSNGGATPGTTGNSGDCQITVYINAPGSHATNPFHVSQDITSWILAENVPNSLCSLNGANISCFFIYGGTVELSGPGAPGPTGVPTPVTFLCDFSSPPDSLAGNPTCDTGIPAVPGHTSLHPAPGVELNIQVTKIG